MLTAVENNDTKWEYTYDVRGNILTKKEYAVTVADDGTKTYTLKENGASTFGYDTVWADKLTSFNGQTITYDEVGNPLTYRGNTLTWNFGRRLASFGNISYTYNEDGIRNLNPFRYRGYYYDTDTSLYYLQSRYYDPETGRFLNSDDVNFIGTTESEISYNPFAYCENDPVNNVDPTGKAMINAVCAAIGAIAGWYFGAWIANRLGYYSGWKYWAIRSGVIVGGAVIGWFAGTVMAYLIRCFIFSSPKMISATPLWVYKFLGIAAGPGTIVLGRYPMYLSLASKLGSGVFSIATSVWNGMSEFARWSANKAFLDKAIQAGKKITLSSNAYKAKPGSYFYKEIQYLLSRGYKIVKNGWEMVKK